MLTGTRAAALGGFTAVHAMANTFPVADTAGVVEQVWRLGREAGYCDVQPVGAVTVGLEGEQLAELGAMADSAAAREGLLRRRQVRRRRRAHAPGAGVREGLRRRRRPARAGAAADRGRPDERGRRLRPSSGLGGWPAVAEESIIARDVLLAAHVGSRLHICHLSTAGSVEIVRWAKSHGSTSPPRSPRTTCCSPTSWSRTLRPGLQGQPAAAHRRGRPGPARGLADGTIDIVATDHAPHPHEDKDCEWAAAAMGMVGLETALSVVQQTMVDTGLLDWAGVADRMSVRPARIGRLDGHGRPARGRRAREPGALRPVARRVVDPAAERPPLRATPVRRRELPGRVVATFLRGRPTVLDGKLA